MKRIYQEPSLEVVEIEIEASVLAQSTAIEMENTPQEFLDGGSMF